MRKPINGPSSDATTGPTNRQSWIASARKLVNAANVYVKEVAQIMGGGAEETIEKAEKYLGSFNTLSTIVDDAISGKYVSLIEELSKGLAKDSDKLPKVMVRLFKAPTIFSSFKEQLAANLAKFQVEDRELASHIVYFPDFYELSNLLVLTCEKESVRGKLAAGPASVGEDVGIFHVNTYYHEKRKSKWEASKFSPLVTTFQELYFCSVTEGKALAYFTDAYKNYNERNGDPKYSSTFDLTAVPLVFLESISYLVKTGLLINDNYLDWLASDYGPKESQAKLFNAVCNGFPTRPYQEILYKKKQRTGFGDRSYYYE